MKKLLLTIGLVAAGSLAYGQGTVFFSNSAGWRISVGDGVAANVAAPTTLQAFNFGLFYGIGQSANLSLVPTLGVNSTSAAGVIASAADNRSGITALQLPGTTPGETDVYVQVRGWSASFGSDWAAAQAASLTPMSGAYFGQTLVVNAVALGPSTGPGAAIWQLATGTDTHKFKGGFTMFTTVPEPSSMALCGLGAAAVLIFRRRR